MSIYAFNYTAMDLEDLLNRPVFDINSERFLGYVVGTVVDADATRLLGILTRTRFARPKMVVPFASIHLIHEDGVLIERSGFRWLPLHRALWSAARQWKQRGHMPALCRKETVGTLVDFAVNDEGLVTHLLLQRGMVVKTLRIRRDKILGIDEGAMRLADDALAKPKPKPSKKAVAGAQSGGFVNEAAALFGKTLAKASHRAKSGARSALVGKPAPWSINDDKGTLLVNEGEPLTPAALAAEAARGRSGTLAGAVAGGALGRSVAKRRSRHKQ